MSWSGTVYCSYCSGKGHNKSGCKARKEWMEELRAADPYDWRVEKYDRENKKSKTRTCSFCFKPGHNRRKCASQEKYKAYFIEKTKEMRSQLLHHLRSHGVGIGALLLDESYTRSNEDSHDGVFMITGLYWELAHWFYRSENSMVKGTRMGTFGVDGFYRNHGYKVEYPIPIADGCPPWIPQDRARWSNENKIIGPVNNLKPPAGWLEVKDEKSLEVLNNYIKDKSANNTVFNEPYKEWLALQESSAE